MPPGIAHALAAAAGALLWIVTSSVSGRREAWDSSLYWTAAYPAALAVAAVLGYLAPERPWRWALTLMLVQPVVMVVQAGAGSMLPIGLVLFGMLSLPAIMLASGAAWLRRRLQGA